MGVRSIIREELAALLHGFINTPFINLREKDYQGALFSELRRRIPNPIAVNINDKLGAPRMARSRDGLHTSRVHLEMCIGSKRSSNPYVKPDIVVLRDAPVNLSCSKCGPTDIQETLQIRDVEALIEVKAAPSQNRGEVNKFMKDAKKLHRLVPTSPLFSCQI